MNNDTQSDETVSRDGSVCARAHPNIALIKYWGKRDTRLNLPAVASVSITLDTLLSDTRVRFDKDLASDQLVLNGNEATGSQAQKLEQLAAIFRKRSGSNECVAVTSDNNFPTAAGLASSASGYAALVVALDRLYETDMSPQQLSIVARMGSGSAARSVFGGFAQMHHGELANGEDCMASALLEPSDWPLEVVVAITSESSKDVSSTEGMELTRTSSVFYQPWVEEQNADIETAIDAISRRDFSALADVSEASCLKMHGLMLSAKPGLIYWNPATLGCIEVVKSLRKKGVPVFFTIDAGPQVKAVCAPGSSQVVADALQSVAGVTRVLQTGLGEGARIVKA